MKKIGNRTILLENKTGIISHAGVAGRKEAEGPLGKYFDKCFSDSLMGEDSWEKAESLLQNTAVKLAIAKLPAAKRRPDVVFAGDLLNQCIASTFGMMEFGVPFVGMYGACSTMALALINAATYVESLCFDQAIAVTSSHFCSAERQYRYPLEYGCFRPPTAQWTVTGSGAAIVSRNADIIINSFTIGKITELGVIDANNMGAAMAPDDVKIRPYPRQGGMVFFYTQIQYLRGFRALFKDFLMQKIVEKSVNEIYAQSRNYYKKEEEF